MASLERETARVSAAATTLHGDYWAADWSNLIDRLDATIKLQEQHDAEGFDFDDPNNDEARADYRQDLWEVWSE